MAPTSQSRRGRRAFTLIEIVFAVLVIFLLMGLLIGGVRLAMRSARGSIDRASVNSLRQAVTLFSQEMGFVPPLVKDDPPGPLDPGKSYVLVYDPTVPQDLTFLQGNVMAPPGAPDKRFSTFSLPVYILGVLDVDGVGGPGLRIPERDGTFKKGGRIFKPFYDVSKNPKSLVNTDPANPARIELRDSNGVPIRYYRWVHTAGPFDPKKPNALFRIPKMVGLDPNEGFNKVLLPIPADQDITLNPKLRDAEFAIVAAGPNGVFGDENDLSYLQDKVGQKGDISKKAFVDRLRRMAREDNIIEVGK